MDVVEIAKGKPSEDGSTVDTVYARNVPFYAVYHADDRVRIQFADSAELQARQHGALAPLNPVRGEIDGLLDDLRCSNDRALVAIADRFNRRVADALTVALEDDVAGARLLLDAVKKDAADERTSIARLEYLRVATATMAIFVSIIFGLTAWQDFPADVRMLWLAAATGTLGAFFSIAIDIRQRCVQTGLRTRDNVADAILRIVVGVIASVMLICLLQSRLVTSIALGTGPGVVPGTGNFSNALVAVLGFVAGFIERLVPDLLAKAVAGTAPAPASGPPPTKVGATASTIGTIAAPSGADTGPPPPLAPPSDAEEDQDADRRVDDEAMPADQITDDPDPTVARATVAAG